MGSTTVTSKGQVTIPKAVRDRLGLRAGDKVEFIEEDGKFVLQKDVEKSPFDKWVGFLKHLEGRTTDEIMEELRGPPLWEEALLPEEDPSEPASSEEPPGR